MFSRKKSQKYTEKEVLDSFKEVKKVKDYLTKKITLFHGSKQDYEEWKGYECEIMGPSILIHKDIFHVCSSKEVYKTYCLKVNYLISENPNFINLKELCEKGIEAVVNLQTVHSTSKSSNRVNGSKIQYGLPVRNQRKYKEYFDEGDLGFIY